MPLHYGTSLRILADDMRMVLLQGCELLAGIFPWDSGGQQ